MTTSTAAIGQRTVLKTVFGGQPAIFFICLVVWTLTNMDQALFGYAIPGILGEFGLPLETIGLVLTIAFATTVPLVIVSGILADRWGRGIVLCGLLFASALAVGLQGFAGGIVVLTLFRSLGFGISGGLSPITNALVVENASARFRGVAMGLLQCGYPLGWFLASFLAAPLLSEYGWRSICFIAFAVMPLAFPVAWMLRRYGVARTPVPSGATDEIRGRNALALLFAPAYRRQALACSGMFFLFGGAYAGSAFFFPTFFTQVRGYSEADAASLVGLSNGIAVFGEIAAALAGEFVLTRRNVFTLWCFGGAVGLAGLLWLSSGRTADIIWYGVTGALFYGSQAVSPVLLAELFPTGIRATALAVCASAPLTVGFAIFPLIVPLVVASTGWQVALTAVVIPLLVASGLVALLLPNRASGLAID